ncbi:hypothetical protein HMPREF3227_00752 [Corynebacterium sp. CMW7794]|nr:hypothetical protein HMPREF0307_01066 [Corynebacterium sp. DNF00584]KXI19011.1 hypothetical protein HMPREF3227_00752 [Corynebacterium sp. CMW7794]MBF9012171.1 hypothetical protein [Corynebacterium phoceense]
MGKQQTSNCVIVETILMTGMKHTDAAELFGVSTRWIRTLLSATATAAYKP